jgi:hypothetical protein
MIAGVGIAGGVEIIIADPVVTGADSYLYYTRFTPESRLIYRVLASRGLIPMSVRRLPLIYTWLTPGLHQRIRRKQRCWWRSPWQLPLAHFWSLTPFAYT